MPNTKHTHNRNIEIIDKFGIYDRREEIVLGLPGLERLFTVLPFGFNRI